MPMTEERKALLKAASEVMYRCRSCGEYVIRGNKHNCVPKKSKAGRKKKVKRLPPPDNTGRNTRTHAIKELEDIQKLKDIIKTSSNHDFVNTRDYCICVWMLNSNLRCVDITLLQYEDLFIDDRGTIRRMKAGEYVTITEKKTGKKRNLYMNRAMEEALIPWIEHRTEKDGWLFVKYRGQRDHLSTKYISDMIKTAGQKAGIQRVSAHSLRKSFCYHQYATFGVDIATLMQMMNHSSVKQTLDYIDISNPELEKAFMNEI